MNLLQRLRNLYNISEFDITDGNKILEKDRIWAKLSKPQQAQIIKKTNDIDQFLNDKS